MADLLYNRGVELEDAMYPNPHAIGTRWLLPDNRGCKITSRNPESDYVLVLLDDGTTKHVSVSFLVPVDA